MTDCRPCSVAELGGILTELRPSVVLLVTGGESFRRCGAADAIEPLLESYEVERISGVSPNPAIEDVSAAIHCIRQSSPDVVVAVGGGSVIDLAKAARGLTSASDLRSAILSGDTVEPVGPPLVAVPTTAGTGSEATHFSAVYVDGVKHSVGHPAFRPDFVLLDPRLTASMPPRLTAVTGLDALAQAMESIWSTRSTAESLGQARAALDLAWANVEDAVLVPTEAVRAAMCCASHRAGLAIDVSRTTAAHALSYAMTIRHGIPHGHAVALTLGALLEHNSSVSDTDCADVRGSGWVRERIGEVLEIVGVASGADGHRALTALLERLGLETRLSELGIATAEERRTIVESVDAVRLVNNPRALDVASLTWIVEAVA